MIIAVFHVSGYLRMCDFTSRRFRRTQHGPDDDLGARANAGGSMGTQLFVSNCTSHQSRSHQKLGDKVIASHSPCLALTLPRRHSTSSPAKARNMPCM